MFKYFAPLYSPKWLTSYFIWPFLILLLLIWLPFTGVFLMFMFGLPFIIAGLFPHMIAVAFIIDVLRKGLPKALILISVLPYVLFYGYYFADQASMKAAEEEIREANKSEFLEYNPNIHSLVMEYTEVGSYNIPVSYSPTTRVPEGYYSKRLLTSEYCKDLKETDKDIITSFVSWRQEGSSYKRKSFPNICIAQIPEIPPKQILEIIKKDPQDRKAPLQKTTYEFSLDGDVIGEYSTAYYNALLPVPLLIYGCGLNSGGPSWDCFGGVYRLKTKLDVTVHEIDTDKYGDWVLAPILNIEKYDESDLEYFKNDPDTLELVINLIRRKANESPNDLDKWGLRKDSLYQGERKIVDGYPGFKGKIYSNEKGGPFYDFITAHEGQIVHLDIIAYPNARLDGFTNYGVCHKDRANCSGGTDDIYRFQTEDGKPYRFKERGVFKGFFRVGPQEDVENKRRPDDHDKKTILTVVTALNSEAEN